MIAPLACPETSRWLAFFNDAIPADEGPTYERHLEACAVCQQQLDRAEEYQDELRRLGRQIGDPTGLPVDGKLSEVVGRLREEGATHPGSAEAVDLYFLRPSSKPGVLGTLGEYEVVEVVGQGGMGIVLKAYEPALQRMVAIKVMAAALAGSARARQRFAREAQSAAAVCHEHVVAVHGVHETAGLPYLVMQYVAGESLQARLDRTGPLELREVVAIGLQTASGLAAAHARGLIHRDVKPANLLLAAAHASLDGTYGAYGTYESHRSHSSHDVLVKITDFGLARMADDAQLTQVGVVAGTPEYMAPEQARGEAVDHRADLFSLGSVLYACCTGRPPFGGATALAVLQQVNEQAPASLRSVKADIPAWMEELVSRLLKKNPDERFQSAAEVAGLLREHLAHLQPPAIIPSSDGLDSGVVSGAVQCRSPRGKWFMMGGSLLALLAVLGLIGRWQLAAQSQPEAQQALSDVFYQDFRGGAALQPPLILVGRNAKQLTKMEKGGVRITLSAQRTFTDRVGIQLNSRLKGDFEVTASYQILKGNRPTAGHGVGVELFVNTVKPADVELGLFRSVRVNEGEVHLVSLCPLVDGKRRYNTRSFPASARAGKLRIARTGAEAVLSVAPEDAGEFEVLCREQLGADDVKLVRVSAYPGHAQNEVDLLIKDLRVRSLTSREAVALAQPETMLHPSSIGWQSVALVLGLAPLLIGLVIWLIVILRRGAAKRGAGVSRLGKGEAAPAAVAFACPGCRKTLKAGPELAGKKVKCPQCGSAAVVPSFQTAITSPAPLAGPKKVKSSRKWLWGGALLGFLILLLAGWAWLPRTAKQPLSMVNVTFGSEVMPEVEESGLYFQEYDVGQPFRWTDGHGKWTIPIDRAKPPEKLALKLWAVRTAGVKTAHLQVIVNGASLLDENIPDQPWKKEIDLRGIDLGDRVVLELNSDTFNPLGSKRFDGRGQSMDPRPLGVQVHGLKLIRAEPGTAEPARSIETAFSFPQAHTTTVAFGRLSADGMTLMSGSLDGTVILWDVASASPRRLLRGLARQPQALAISPDGQTFATATTDRIVRVWSIKPWLTKVSEFRGHRGRILDLAYSPDGNTLAAAGDDDLNGGELRLWDLATAAERVAVDPFGFRLWGTAYAPDGKSVAVVGGERTAHVVDTNTGKEIAAYTQPGCGQGVAFSRDGMRMAVAYGQDGRVRLHDLRGGAAPVDFQVPGGKRIFGLDFAPDGKQLLTAGEDGMVILWDVSGKEARAEARLAGHEGVVRWVRFLPDGKKALTGGADKTIRLWSLGTSPPGKPSS